MYIHTCVYICHIYIYTKEHHAAPAGLQERKQVTDEIAKNRCTKWIQTANAFKINS